MFTIDTQLAQDIRRLWKDTSIRQIYQRRDEFVLSDSACYYLNSVERIGEEKYVPNEIDILRYQPTHIYYEVRPLLKF